MEFFIEKNLDNFKRRIGYINQKMINDKKLQDLMAEAVKVRQNEIMEKI